MSNSCQEWIKRAKSSIILAKESLGEEVFLEDLCFQAQQAAEKSIKSIFIYFALEFPNTHNFNVLLLKLKGTIDVPAEIQRVIELNDYAVQTRYPGDYFPVTKEEYYDAIEIAESVYNWAKMVTKSI